MFSFQAAQDSSAAQTNAETASKVEAKWDGEARTCMYRFFSSLTKFCIYTYDIFVKNTRRIIMKTSTTTYCNTIEPIPVDWDKRPVILVYGPGNILVARSYGETAEELLQAHFEHRCGVFCGYCYHEAMVSIGKEEPEDWLIAHQNNELISCVRCPNYHTMACETCSNPEEMGIIKHKTVNAQVKDGIYPDPNAEYIPF